jgi:hypothetical protein
VLPGRTRERRRGRDDQAGPATRAPCRGHPTPSHSTSTSTAWIVAVNRPRRSATSWTRTSTRAPQGVSHQPLELHRVPRANTTAFPESTLIQRTMESLRTITIPPSPAPKTNQPGGLLPPRKPRDPQNDENSRPDHAPAGSFGKPRRVVQGTTLTCARGGVESQDIPDRCLKTSRTSWVNAGGGCRKPVW